MAAFYPTSRANEAAEAARTGLDEMNAEAEAELTGSASDAGCGVGGIKDTDDRRPDRPFAKPQIFVRYEILPSNPLLFTMRPGPSKPGLRSSLIDNSPETA